MTLSPPALRSDAPTAIEPAAGASTSTDSAEALGEAFRAVRAFTAQLCEPLAVEDYVIQTMPDVSPTKWHLAHTSWFFERFVLLPHLPGYREMHPQYNYLFNSYYNAVGYRHCRPKRGFISRPTVADVHAYRAWVDDGILRLLAGADARALEAIAPLLTLGCHHEQQHQELMLTDLKHVFAENPLFPAYRAGPVDPGAPSPLAWVRGPDGLVEIGHAGPGFAFDNESPHHRVYLQPFALASRLVTAGEYLAFIDDGGYARAELWQSAGWDAVARGGIQAPLYWQDHGDGDWRMMTLAGVRPVDPHEPVCHVSWFEAEAYARWADARLPAEFEWEAAATAAGSPSRGRFAEGGRFHPGSPSAKDAGPLRQLLGEAWQWTRSDYAPYPGYRPAAGALGEYNGKFMSGQYVLRGASCATPRSHARTTYRNFFPPDARWQFSGIRLARDVE